MLRPAVALFAAAALALPARADDPEFNGRPGSEWVKILKEDSSPRKRRAAVVALGQLWTTNLYRESLPNIARAVKADSASAVRSEAAAAFGQLKRDDAKFYIGDLTAALKLEQDAGVRKELVTTLGRYGDLAAPAVGPLTDSLRDADPAVRVAAAEALGRVGPEAKEAAKLLLPMLRATEPGVKAAAAFALARVEPEDRAAAGAALVEVLAAETDAAFRRELVISLGLLGDTSDPVAAALVKALADPDAELRQQAARALRTFGPAVRPAVPALLKAVTDDADKGVRVDALRALGSALGPAGMKELIPVLTARLKADPDFEVRIAVADELGALGPDGKEAVAALRQARSDPQVKVREAAAAAVQQIEKPAPKPKADEPPKP